MDHQFYSRLGPFSASLFIVFLAVALLPGRLSAQTQQQRDEWDMALFLYQNQLLEHAGLPKDTSWVYPFLDALDIDAKDRQELTAYAQAAQAVHNDYYYNKFMDLVGEAQINGNDVLKKANEYRNILAEEPCKDYHCWVNLGFMVKNNGLRLYEKALEMKFDAEITREQARKLLNMGMDAMDSQGPWVDGEPAPNADAELYGIDTYIRQACPPFPLPAEYERATEVMNRYLIDTLCKLPSGHQHYLDLAKQYKLERAQRHIEGFYAFVVGKVEVDRGEGPKPARGAKVTVTDPHDQREWSATTTSGGHYDLQKVILHKKCSPFHIVAEFEGEKKEEDFEGPLDEPDPTYRFEKNFLFKKRPPDCGYGSFQSTETWERHSGPPFDKGTETRQGQVTFTSYSRGKFTGTMTIHYTHHRVFEDSLYIKTYHDEGTATVACSMTYSWGDPDGRYSFGSKDFEVHRNEEIVHKPFGGRGQWTETKESTEVRSQTGYIHSGTKNKPPRWALDLSGSVHESEKGHTVDFTWNFKLCKPESK
jgi:hypothetical protein